MKRCQHHKLLEKCKSKLQWGTTSHCSEWSSLKTLQITSTWISHRCTYVNASLVAQMVKNLLAMQETWVCSLGWEDPLEKEMATHFSILPGESHGQRSLAGYSPWGCKVIEWLTLRFNTANWKCTKYFCFFPFFLVEVTGSYIFVLKMWEGWHFPADPQWLRLCAFNAKGEGSNTG